jgi:hypothetical protein
MAKNEFYLAMAEEAIRSIKEASTVGFLPLVSPVVPEFIPDDRFRTEARGEATGKGEHAMIRYSKAWKAAFAFNFFTEAGTTAGMMGTILKHYFGDVTTVQNSATGQYIHMMYIVDDPFLTAALGTKALTVNVNWNEGPTMKNHPYVGGRVMGLTFNQEAGQHLVLTVDMGGSFRDDVTAEIGSIVQPAENLRCDFNNCTVYTGTITRVGSAPDYTDITFGSATQIKPDSISVKIENGTEDALRLDGKDYADHTRKIAKPKVTIEMTIDYADPASGFSSVDDLEAWIAAASSTNLAIVWDTGTPAGSGDNHMLILDIPIAQRMGALPEYDVEKDPMITLKFEGLVDTTTTSYLLGLALKNTASAV